MSKIGSHETGPPLPHRDAKIPDLESRMVATPPRSIIMAEYALYVMLDSVFWQITVYRAFRKNCIEKKCGKSFFHNDPPTAGQGWPLDRLCRNISKLSKRDIWTVPYSSAFGEMSQTDVFFNANCPVLECFRIFFGSKLILTDDRQTDRRQTTDRRTWNLERSLRNRPFRQLCLYFVKTVATKVRLYKL